MARSCKCSAVSACCTFLSSISRSDPDLRFGLVNGDLVIAVVDLREQFTRGDMLIISDGHVRDVTSDLWRNREVARGDEGIVSGFIVANR